MPLSLERFLAFLEHLKQDIPPLVLFSLFLFFASVGRPWLAGQYRETLHTLEVDQVHLCMNQSFWRKELFRKPPTKQTDTCECAGGPPFEPEEVEHQLLSCLREQEQREQLSVETCFRQVERFLENRSNVRTVTRFLRCYEPFVTERQLRHQSLLIMLCVLELPCVLAIVRAIISTQCARRRLLWAPWALATIGDFLYLYFTLSYGSAWKVPTAFYFHRYRMVFSLLIQYIYFTIYVFWLPPSVKVGQVP